MSQDVVIRCATLPVAGPVEGTWQDLWSDLHACWKDTTACSNWLMTELAKADHARLPGDEKLPKMTYPYLYPRASRLFPALSRICCASLIRSVTAKYRKQRFAVMWTHAASLPLFRYPTPYPVHNQAWRAYFDAGNRPVVSLPLGSGNNRRWELRLKGGPEFRRQLGLFRQIVESGIKKAEAKIYRQGGHLLVGLVAWFPRPPAKGRTHTLLLRTDPSAFWVAEIEGQNPRVWNQDDLRRLQESHKIYLQRVAEDSKHERRLPPQKLRHIHRAREERCAKHARRIDTACHQLTAEIAGLADRLGVAEVIYDDTEKGYLDRFPWHKVKTLLAYKLDGLGIVLTTAGEGDLASTKEAECG